MNESRSRFSKKISGRTQGNGMFKWFMLFVYIVLCSYVFTGWFRWRKWMEIPHWKIVSIGIAFLLLLLASSIFLGEFLPQSEIQLKILQFGNYWIGFLIYVISFILVCDLIWLLEKYNQHRFQRSFSSVCPIQQLPSPYGFSYSPAAGQTMTSPFCI